MPRQTADWAASTRGQDIIPGQLLPILREEPARTNRPAATRVLRDVPVTERPVVLEPAS